MPFGLFKRKKKDEVSAEESAKSPVSSSAVTYRQIKVKEVVRETPDAISIVFDNPAEGKIPYQAGQFFTLIPVVNGKKVRRAYSVCTSPYTDDYPAVTVKKVEGGIVSTFLNEHLKAGDELEIMDPMGNFKVEPSGQARHLILLGGGSGITPLMSITKTILSQEEDSRVSLLYANRNSSSIIFRQQLDELKQQYGNRFTLVHMLDEGAGEISALAGPPSEEALLNWLKELPRTEELPVSYWVCGPEGMMANSLKVLEALNIPAEQVHKESFLPGAPESQASQTVANAESAGDQSYEVKVIVDGDEHTFVVEPGKTILETALELDIDLPYSCQSGLCTACRGKCISGKVRLEESEGLSEEELAENYVLTCVGHPQSENVVIEIG